MSLKGKPKEAKVEAGRVGIVLKSGTMPPPEADRRSGRPMTRFRWRFPSRSLKEAEQIDLVPEESGLGGEIQGRWVRLSRNAHRKIRRGRRHLLT